MADREVDAPHTGHREDPEPATNDHEDARSVGDPEVAPPAEPESLTPADVAAEASSASDDASDDAIGENDAPSESSAPKLDDSPANGPGTSACVPEEAPANGTTTPVIVEHVVTDGGTRYLITAASGDHAVPEHLVVRLHREVVETPAPRQSFSPAQALHLATSGPVRARATSGEPDPTSQPRAHRSAGRS